MLQISMQKYLLWIGLLLAFNPYQSLAQELPLTGFPSKIKGTVEIQKNGTGLWIDVDKETLIENGDLLKTLPRSFCIIQFQNSGKLTIAANSTILFEGTLLEEGSPPIPFINIQAGGILSRWKEPSGIVFGTKLGIAYQSTGSLLAVAPTESKATFLSVSGQAIVQDISTQEEVNILERQYTQLKVSSPPTSPQLINKATLIAYKKFFPSKLLKKILYAKKKSINKKGRKRKNWRAVAKNKKRKPKVEKREFSNLKQSSYEAPTKIKPFFNVNHIIKQTRDIDKLNEPVYHPPYWIDPFKEFNFFFETRLNLLIANSLEPSSYKGLRLRFGLTLSSLALAFNLPVETQADGGINSLTFDTKQQLLDKIYFVDYKDQNLGLNIHFGEIRNLTIHSGGLISDFSNELRSQTEQPLGLLIDYSPFPKFTALLFSPSIGDAEVLGGSITFNNGYFGLGTAVITDMNQSEGYTSGDIIFRGDSIPTSLNVSNTGVFFAYEVFSQFSLIQRSQFHAFLYISTSFLHSKGSLIGYSAQSPRIEVNYRKLSTFIEGRISGGRLTPGYFNRFYGENRTQIINNRSLSYNEFHPPLADNSKGFLGGVSYQFGRTLWAEAQYGQNFSNKISYSKNYPEATVLQPLRDLYKLNVNRTMKFRIFSGNNFLDNLERAEVYYLLTGGKFRREILTTPRLSNRVSPTQDLSDFELYENITATSSESFFNSLNMEYGALIEYRVIENSSILAQFRGYSLDLDNNGIYSQGDDILEFSTTWRMKF